MTGDEGITMTDGDMNARASAIDAFTERLVQVRAGAGDPSFRTMAKRSGAISHATMHDAVQGVRLPSWETTVEFAKACGIDPDSLREEWEKADAIVHPPESSETSQVDAEVTPDSPVGVARGTDASAPVGPADADPLAGESEGAARPDPVPATEPTPQRSAAFTKALMGVAAVLVLGLIVALGVRQFSDEPATAAAESSDGYPPVPSGLVGTRMGDKGCPENQKHADGTQDPPRTAGDRGQLGRDGGFQDCDVQKRGAQVVRIFTLINEGKIDWVGRKVVHIQADTTNPGCTVPREVVIPPIRAGSRGVVEVAVTAPEQPGVCFARFMQLDKDRQWAFPDQRPYFLSLKVE